jgi:hypothetical protein
LVLKSVFGVGLKHGWAYIESYNRGCVFLYVEAYLYAYTINDFSLIFALFPAVAHQINLELLWQS